MGDIVDAFLHGLIKFPDMMQWSRFSDLSVIDKRVLMIRVIFSYIREESGIQDKQNRLKDS